MTAQLATTPRPLPLLLDPERPRPGQRGVQGWRKAVVTQRGLFDGGETSSGYVRDHADDAQGALVQWAIVRYRLRGVTRRALAGEIFIGETQLQYWLRGEAQQSYGRPVLDALARLGISAGRGDRYGPGGRWEEIVRAMAAVMARALERPTDAGVARDLRLLSAPWAQPSEGR